MAISILNAIRRVGIALGVFQLSPAYCTAFTRQVRSNIIDQSIEIISFFVVAAERHIQIGGLLR